MSGVKGCGLGRPGLLRMFQDHCYFGLRDLKEVSCWSSCFSGVSLDVSSFVCHTISPAAFVSPLLWDCSSPNPQVKQHGMRQLRCIVQLDMMGAFEVA